MAYKVSVVVPIYGAEKTIERCARSLFEQSLKELEFVFVNDCTPDRSVDILKRVLSRYPQRASDVQIVNHSHNKGSAKARHTGIEHCHGEYIIQCDSDDWIDVETYALMYEKARLCKADVVICDCYTTDGLHREVYPATHPVDPKQWILDMLHMRSPWTLWNKLFRSGLYHQAITYPDCSMGEDCAMVLQLAYYCKRIAYVERPLYYYYNNVASMVNNKSPEARYRKFCEAMANSRLVARFYQDKPENGDKLLKGGLDFLFFYTKSLLLPLIGEREYRKVWRDTCPGVEFRVLTDSTNDRKERIRSLLILLRIYPRVTNFLHLTHCI